MNEHVSNALSGLFASTTSQLQPKVAGARRRMRLSLGVVCALAVMFVAIFAAPNAQAAPGTKIVSAQLPVSSPLWGAPTGVAVDQSGNVYVADFTNNQIDVINPNTLAVSVLISSSTSLAGSTLNAPQMLAVNGNNLYIVDQHNNRIVQYPLAGGPAVALAVSSINAYSLAFDHAGNLFVLYSGVCGAPGSCEVDEYSAASLASFATATPSAIIPSVTLAIAGSINPVGIAFDASNNMYVSDNITGTVYQLAAPAYASASVFRLIPSAGQIGFDAQNNFYAVNRASNVVDAWASPLYLTATQLTLGLAGANGVAIDASGNLFVTEDTSGVIVEKVFPAIFPSDSAVSLPTSAAPYSGLQVVVSVNGAQPLTSAPILTQGQTSLDFSALTPDTNPNRCVYPVGVTSYCTVDVTFNPNAPGLRQGVVYARNGATILSTLNIGGNGVGPVLAFLPATQQLVGTALATPLKTAFNTTTDANNYLYIADTGNNRIVIAPPTDLNCTVIADCTIISGVSIKQPEGVAVDGAGNLYVANFGFNTALVFPYTGLSGLAKTFGSSSLVADSLSAPPLSGPASIAVDAGGNVYIADRNNARVVKVPANDLHCSTAGDCIFLASDALTPGGGLNQPTGVAVDGLGNAYIADFFANMVVRVPYTDPTCALGQCSLVADGGGYAPFQPEGVAVGESGNLIIANHVSPYVIVVPPNDLHCTTVGDCVSLGTGLFAPQGVSAAPNGNIFIADLGNNRVVELAVSNPPTLTFPTLTQIGSVDTTDGGLSVQISNIGNGDLVFEVPLSGTNPYTSGGFGPFASGTCAALTTSSSTATLAPGASCTTFAQFAPDGTGLNPALLVNNTTGTLDLLDNALGGSLWPYTSQVVANLVGTSNTTATVTVNSSPSLPGAVGGGGTYTIGSSHTISASSPVTNLAGDTQYTFGSWSDAGAQSHSITVGPLGNTFTANFSPSAYKLTVSVNNPPGCSGTAGTSGFYSIGATPTVTATAGGAFCVFNGWSGGVASSGSPITTVNALNAPATVTANFQLTTSNITVASSVTGLTITTPSGSYVTSHTDTVNNGTPSYTFSTTTTQDLAGYRYAFQNWSAGPTPGSLSQTIAPVTSGGTFTANFTAVAVLLTVNTTSPAFCSSSTVSPVTQWVNLPATGAVAISASPAPGCYFKGWTGPGIANPNAQSTTVTMTGVPLTITADIEPIPYYVITVKTDDPQTTGSPSNGIAANCTPFLPPATPLPPTNPATPLDTNCSLRDAVTAAMANNGGAGYISWSHYEAPAFTQLLTGTTFLESALPNVSGLVSITGPGQSVIEVDGDNTYRVFTIDASAPNATNVSITSLKLSDGNATYGGGIDVVGGTVVLDNLYLYHNTAYPNGAGGGLFVESGGVVALTNSAFSNNTAVGGGAILNDGTLSITNVSFSKDNAVQFTAGGPSVSGWGGAIYQDGSPLTISDSTFNGETAYASGGAVYAISDAVIRYSTFFQNLVTNGDGGAIANNGANVSVYNSTLASNSTPLGNGAGAYNNGVFNIFNSIVSGGSSKGAAGLDSVGAAVTTADYNDFYNNIDTLTNLEDDCYRCGIPSSGSSNTHAIVVGNPLVNANPNLQPAPLQNGSVRVPPTFTLLPLPTSAAICAANPAYVPGPGLEQRGLVNYNGSYTGSLCIDLGAVQTNYSLALGVQPTNVAPGTNMTPAPTVILSESGAPFTGASLPVSLTDAAADLTTTPATASTSVLPASAGVATFSSLIFTGPATADTLTAAVSLNSNLPLGLPLTAGPSSTFNVNAISPTVTMPVGAQIFGPKIGSAYLNSATAFGLVGGVNTNITADGTWTYTSSPNPTCYGAGPIYVPAPCASNVVTANSVFSVGTYTITATFTPTVAPYNTYFTAASSTATSNYTVTIQTPEDPYVPAPASQVYSSPIALGSLDATFTGTVLGNPGTSLNGPDATCPTSANCSQYGTITYTATTAGGTVITNLTPGVGGTVLPVGAYTLTATFTPNATWAAQLTPVSGTAAYQVTQASPTFSPTWAPTVNTQSYGIPIPTGVLDATVTNATRGATTTTVPGTFHYTTTINGVPNLAITAGAGGTVLPVGSYTLGVTFIPQDSANFTSSSTTYSTYTVTQATPVVSFAPVPSTQVYGTNVLPGVLDATASYAISPSSPGNTLPVAGTFSYTAQAGAGPIISLSPQTAALPVGNYTITASFTPNDTTNYSSVTGTASYSVIALSPTLSLSPASQPYGPTIGVANSSYATSATATAVVNGSSQTIPGTWSYAISGCTVSLSGLTAVQLAAEQLKACVYTVTGTFTPNGVSGALAATNFASNTVTSTYTVTQVTPTVVYTPVPSSSTYHQALVANSLTNAITATNPNLISPGNTVAGTTTFSTTISSVPNQAVTVGQTSLPANTYLITATFTPTDTQDYATTTASAYYTVNQQTPLATVLPFVASPASQNYGGPIAAGTFALTATDSVLSSTPVAGSYTYTTLVSGVTTTLTQGIGGTVLPAGTYTVTASFTPSDTVDYTGLATPLPTVTYTVNAAPTTTTFAPPFSSMVYGTTIPSAFFNAAASYVVPPSGNSNSAAPAGSFTYYLGTACSGTQISTASAPLAASSTPYSITACFKPTDTSEFVTSFATSTLTVTPLAPTLSLTAAAQNYGPTVATVNSTYTSATPGNNFASATAVINGTTTVIPGTWAISMTGCGTTISSVISTSVLPACTAYAVTATFTPTGTSGNTIASNYIAGGTATSTYTVNVVTPTLSYSPSQVTQVFGTTVPAGVFDALATNANLSNPNTTPANPIPGTWSYTTSINNSSNASQIGTSTNNPSAGTSSSTVLPAGQYLIVATFTPTDTKDYASAAFITKAYTVTPAPPTDNFVPTPATQVYGTPITGVGAGTSLDANFFDPTTSANINASGVISYTAQNGSGPVITLIPNTTILQVGNYTLTASFAPNPGTSYLPATLTAAYSVTKNTPQLIFNPSPSSQSFGTPITAGSLNAVAMANGMVVPGTVTYTATVGTTTVPAIAGVTILPASTYTLTASFTPYDTTDYSALTATATYTVNQAVPLITLTSSASPIFASNAVTFTAIVSLNNVPGNVVAYLNGGTVNFLNGTTQIGTGTIINGVATFTTSSLPVAANSITAVYAGSANFTSATSAALTETVTDFNFSLTLNSFTLQPNHEAVVNFTVSPLGLSTFPSNITLSLNGLPAGATYSFTPSTILAGTGAQQDVLTISVPPTTTVGKVEPAAGFSGKLPTLALALLLLPFAGRLRKNSKRLSRLLSILLLVVAGLTASIGFSGCGANIGGFFGQQPQTYTVTLTGTSGTLSHSTTITLNVE